MIAATGAARSSDLRVTPRPAGRASRRRQRGYRCPISLSRIEPEPGILYRADDVEVVVVGLRASLFHPADVHVLDDVACFRIDGNRAARALVVFPARKDIHGLVTIEDAFGLLHEVKNSVHSIPPSG